MDRKQSDIEYPSAENQSKQLFLPGKRYFYILPLLWSHLCCIFLFLCSLISIYVFFHILVFVDWQRELGSNLFGVSLQLERRSLDFLCANEDYIWILAIVLAVFYALQALKSSVSLAARFKKCRYIIDKNYLIVKQGGLFYDFESELQIKNITSIALIRSFIQRLFGTGDVYMQLAGSNNEKIEKIEKIEQPERFYQSVLHVMQKSELPLNSKCLQKTSIFKECMLMNTVIFALTLISALIFYKKYAFLISYDGSAIWSICGIFFVGAMIALVACIIKWRSIDLLPILSTMVDPSYLPRINESNNESLEPRQNKIPESPSSIKIVRKPSALHSLPSLLRALLQAVGIVFLWVAFKFLIEYWPNFASQKFKPWIAEHHQVLGIAACVMLCLMLLPFLCRLLFSRLFTFTIDTGQVTKSEGYFIKLNSVVFFRDIYRISLQRHFLNEFCKTATIELETFDRKAEKMVLHDIPNFREFYQNIKQQIHSEWLASEVAWG